MRVALPIVGLDNVDWSSPNCVPLPAGPAIGLATRPLPPNAAPVLDRLIFTYAPSGPGRRWVPVEPADVVVDPSVMRVLLDVLAVTPRVPVAEAVAVESLAYSLLLAGPAFARWRREHPVRMRPEGSEDVEPVRMHRDGRCLHVTLDRGRRHNAFNRSMRDGLLAALDVARLDPTIEEVRLTGTGRSFCAGGDLDEFGTARDTVAAHSVRLAASVGLAVHELRQKVRPVLHGACIGAGIEIPAFAEHVVAHEGAHFSLPELNLGLIPGAGGTVSVCRRIGPARTAYLALTGARIDVATALEWGLVDERC